MSSTSQATKVSKEKVSLLRVTRESGESCQQMDNSCAILSDL